MELLSDIYWGWIHFLSLVILDKMFLSNLKHKRFLSVERNVILIKLFILNDSWDNNNDLLWLAANTPSHPEIEYYSNQITASAECSNYVRYFCALSLQKCVKNRSFVKFYWLSWPYRTPGIMLANQNDVSSPNSFSAQFVCWWAIKAMTCSYIDTNIMPLFEIVSF